MSTAATQPTLRQRVEATLLLHPGRDVALTRLYELLPDISTAQVKAAVKGLTKTGAAVRHGTIRHPAYQLVRTGNPLHLPADAASAVGARSKRRTTAAPLTAAPARVTWPSDVRVQHAPTKGRIDPFSGIDWASAMTRAGCQDHLQVPSRRGEARVQHRGPMGICGARKRQDHTERGQP